MLKLKNLPAIIILSMIAFLDGFGQSAENSPIPPSPTAASLGEYGSYDVSLFTGTPSIEIPLYAIKEKDIELPISLSYNAKGVRVSETGSWVGTSWSLNCGGVITRTRYGKADEIDDGFLETKAFLGKKIEDNNINYPVLDNITYCDFLYNVTNSRTYGDTEPDLFFYHFGEYSGSFVFGHGKDQINTIPHSKIKIELFSTNREINGFIITTTDGYKYYFGNFSQDDNAVEVTTTYTRGIGGTSDPTEFNSSWYLIKIEKPDGREVMSFSYIDDFEKSTSISENSTYGPWEMNISGSICDRPATVGRSYTDIITEIDSKKLKLIYSENHIVEFETSDRTDDSSWADYLDTGKKLDKIKIFHSSADPISQIPYKELNFNYTIISENSRFFLDSVEEVHSTSVSRNYNFMYKNPELLPNWRSIEQDHWGYFNNNDAETLCPNFLYNIDWSALSFDMADRCSNPLTADYGMLNKITYPTGGTTEFEFEVNEVHNANIPHAPTSENSNFVGGVRIKKMINRTSNSEEIKNYLYTEDGISSGELFLTPDYYFEYKQYLDFVIEPEVPIALKCIGSYKGVSANPVRPLSNYIGSPYGYSSVTVLYGEQGENGKEVNTFNTINWGLNLGGDFITGKLEEKIIYENENSNYFPVSKTTYEYHTYYPLDYKTISLVVKEVNIGGTCPTGDYSWDAEKYDQDVYYFYSTWVHPIKTTEEKYTDNGTITSIKDYTYNHNNLQVNSLEEDKSDNSIYKTQYKYPTDFLYSSCINEYEQCVSDRNTMLIGCTQDYINWDTNPGDYPNYDSNWETGDYMTCYNAAYTTYPCKDDFITNTILAANVADEKSRAIIGQLINNIIRFPVEEIYAVNDRVIDGNLNLLKVKDSSVDIYEWLISPSVAMKSIIEPSQNVLIEDFLSETGYTEGPDGSITSVDFSYNQNYNDKIIFDEYDGYGNLLQYHKNNDINISYIWGYNNTYPIARVENATHTEVAHSSFEDGVGSSWLCGNGTFYNDGVTGKISYEPQGSSLQTIAILPAGKYIVSMYVKRVSEAIPDSYVLYNGGQYTFSPGIDLDWVYQEKIITLSGSQVISLDATNVKIDELKLYPYDAQMTTYTYDPLIGMTSQTDPNGITTYYEYDDFGRLIRTKDNDGNTLQEQKYHYKDQ